MAASCLRRQLGFIALFGIAFDNGVLMTTYIQQTLMFRKIYDVEDLCNAIYEAAGRSFHNIRQNNMKLRRIPIFADKSGLLI